ncbi:MAG: glycine cleavage system protein GcvH [bacterium]|nr:glycine cleavage system protein GcvH [bacterium]
MKADYEIPEDLLYTEEHEWLRRDEEDPDQGTIGITDFAQDGVGDVVYLDLPSEGDSVSAGEPCGEIESAKTVSDLYAPVDGVVVVTNGELEDQPELVNLSPYGDGWLIRVRMADAGQLGTLLDASAYRTLLEDH